MFRMRIFAVPTGYQDMDQEGKTMHSNIIEVNRINDSLYLLNENISEEGFITMMLLIGEKSAAIIDTGMGINQQNIFMSIFVNNL